MSQQVGERFDIRDIAFAVQNYVALIAALFIALVLDLPKPLWSMLTVFIVASPISGELRSKAVYRVLGTIAGAAFAVIVTPFLSNAPELMCLVLAIWVAVCLYTSLIERTPRSYAYMLAGYTAAIVMFSNTSTPDLIFQTAIARAEEISVAIISSCVIHSMFLPRTASAAVKARVAKIMGGVDRWASDGLLGREVSAAADRRRLASDITALHMATTHLAFDTGFLPPDRQVLAAMQHRLTLLSPLMSGFEDRMAQVRQAGGNVDDLTAMAQEAGAWLESADREAHGASVVAARCHALERTSLTGRPDWSALLVASASARLADLLSTVSDCHDLARAIKTSRAPRSAHLRQMGSLAGGRPLHRDHLVAALSGMTAAAAVLCACAIWILTAWPQGGTAATFAAIGCCLFAVIDDPRFSLLRLILSIGAGIPVAAVYTFLILPQLDGFVMLAAALAPVILVISYFQTKSAWGLPALGFALGFVGALDIQQRYTGDLAAFINGNTAEVGGLIFAYTMIRLIRVLDAEWVARRMMRHAWRSIAALARARGRVRRDQWLSAAVDRLGLVIPRLPSASQELDAARLINDIQVGLNVLEIRTVKKGLDLGGRTSLDGVLEAVAQVFSRRNPRREGPADLKALMAIDSALSVCIILEDTPSRRRALVALTGLRRSVFPQKSDFVRVAA